MAEEQGIQDWTGINPFYSNDMALNMKPDGGRCIRSYLVPWDRLEDIAAQFVGQPTGITSEGMERNLPEVVAYIENDSYPNKFYYASDVDIRPLGGGGYLQGTSFDPPSEGGDGTIYPGSLPAGKFGFTPSPTQQQSQLYRVWDFALMTVTYQTRAEDILFLDDIEDFGVWPQGPPEANRYVIWNDEEGVQWGVLDNAAWVQLQTNNDGSLQGSASGTPAVGNKVGLPYAQGNVSMTWFDVLPDAFDDQNAKFLNGKANWGWFFNYPPQTLIFNGFKRRRKRDCFGNRTFNLEFTFTERPVPYPPGTTPNNWTTGIYSSLPNPGVNWAINGKGQYSPMQTLPSVSLAYGVNPIKLGFFSTLFTPQGAAGHLVSIPSGIKPGTAPFVPSFEFQTQP